MEPAEELQKQQQGDFAKKVNEMQKFLPCLEQRIESATLQNVKDEELQKWKLLRQVLCGEQQVPAGSDSLTLLDLNKYAEMLEVEATEETTTKTLDIDNECPKENMASNESNTELHSKDQDKSAETEETSASTKSPEGETKVPESESEKNVSNKQNKSENDKGAHNEDETSAIMQNGTLETVTNGVSSENSSLSEEHNTITPDAANEEKSLKDTNDKIGTATSPNKIKKLDSKSSEEQKDDEKSQQASDGKAQQIAEDLEPPDDLEEIEYEGVELIKIPDENAEDEMILPDSADEADFTMNESEAEEDDEEEEENDEQRLDSKRDEQQVEEEDDYQQQVEKGEEKQAQGVEKEEQGKQAAEKQVEKDEDEEGDIDDENTADKAIPISNADNDASGDSVEKASVQRQKDAATHPSDSNSRKDTDDDENNSNDNVAADAASDAEVAAIEEAASQTHVIDDESSSLPAEHIVDMDSRSGHAQESSNDCDDPLGEAEGDGNKGSNKASSSAAKEKKTDEKTAVATSSSAKVTEQRNDDDDDDDVEIIETRDSPICLDTDDDDEQTNTRLTTTTTTTKTIDLRNAKASTEQPIKRTAETIDLLDSSDEESSNTNKRQQTKRGPNSRLTLMKSLAKMPQSTRGRKRTLLPAVQAQKPLKISQVLSGAAVPANCRAFNTPTNKAQQIAKSAKSVLLFPPTSFKPTPQSNFLNAVNLLPTATTSGENPLAFSATLSNKNIIIPNAFYANRRTTTSKEAEEGKEISSTSTTAAKSSTSVSTTAATPSSSTLATPPSKTMPKVQTITVTQQQERVYREWLDEFIENFANPQQIATHSCLVLLQSALRYKSFARIKDLRTSLNTRAFSSNSIADGQLTRELHNIFYTPDCRLTSEGFRFCAAACTQNGNYVSLMTDARTGRTMVRTCPYDELLTKYGLNNNGGAGSSTPCDDKRRRRGDDEYTPAKYYEKKVEPPKSGERRKSLRQHRTRCYDETYLYEPAEGEQDDEPLANVIRKGGGVVSTKSRQAAQMLDLVQRKAEEKRLEAKRQREQQVKSFESAYLEMFANTMRGTTKKTFGTKLPASADSSDSVDSRHSEDADTNHSTQQVVIDDDDDEACFEEDEPRSHRIYKVVPTNLIAAPRHGAKRVEDDEDYEPENIYGDDNATPTTSNKPGHKRGRPRKQNIKNVKTQKTANEPELITCDSTSGESFNGDNAQLQDAEEQNVPKNSNPNWHAGTDWCRICNKRIPRTVAHYVNEHPNNEVYTSRIPKNNLARLRIQGGQILKMHPYLNGQEQYAAECAFCNKTCCFKLSYWYQHYSMHTGEYAYRCSGCNARKPTRSAMTVHINQPCRKRGKLLEDYTYNARPKYIEVRVCKLCNYTQLNQRNVWNHLRTQHGVKYMQKKNIESLILLRMPEQEVDQMLEDAKEFMDLSSGGDENGDSNQMAMTFNYDSFNDVAAQFDNGAGGVWDDGDPTDDLSYMICGMLDVEMRNDAE